MDCIGLQALSDSSGSLNESVSHASNDDEKDQNSINNSNEMDIDIINEPTAEEKVFLIKNNVFLKIEFIIKFHILRKNTFTINIKMV
jgi:hypothetical protein